MLLYCDRNNLDNGQNSIHFRVELACSDSLFKEKWSWNDVGPGYNTTEHDFIQEPKKEFCVENA